MKCRVLLLSFVIALTSIAATAADFGVHGGYFWGDLKNWIVGVDAQWPIGPVAFAPNVDYTRKNGVNFYAVSGNLDLRTDSGGTAYWIGAGPTYAYAEFQGVHDSEWGYNVDAGAAWKMGGLKPYIDGRYYKIKDFKSGGIALGLRF